MKYSERKISQGILPLMEYDTLSLLRPYVNKKLRHFFKHSYPIKHKVGTTL